MASNINDNFDTSLSAETSGPNAGSVLKTTFIAVLNAIKGALSTAKAEISDLQDELSTKAASSHSHDPSAITNLSALIQDTVGNMIVPGANVTVVYNPASGKITINSIGSGSSNAPSVVSVSNVSATEGQNFSHTVTLSAPTTQTTTYSFAVSGVTATAGVDYGTTYVFSGGVTLVSGLLVVPVGISSFTITVATVNDTDVESLETYTIAVNGVIGTGTIVDNDSLTTPTVSTVTSASATEGGNLVHTVTLSSATFASTTYSFNVSDVTTAGVADYLTTYTFSNGVTRSGGTLTVPIGVGSFTVTVDTVNDATIESTETYTITIGGVAATGTIVDEDGSGSGAAITTPTVSKSGVFTTVTFTTNSSTRGAVEFGPTTAYGYSVAEDFGTNTTTHTIVLEAAANPIYSPHGLQSGQTYQLRAVAGVNGILVSSNITFVA